MQPINLNPTFSKPSHHKARPAFLRACSTYLTKRPLSKWDGWQLIHSVHGKSKLYENAAKSMDAIAHALVHFVDLTSGVVEANVTKIAELTGLMTQSKAGNESISRCSRGIVRLDKAGLVETELVWDKNLGCHLPKFINVTDQFWQIVHPEGLEGYLKAREQQLAYRNQGLANDNEWLTVTEAKERRRLAHIKNAFEYRKYGQQQAKARRIAKQMKETNHLDMRAKIGREILAEVDTCHGLTPRAFEKMINQRMALYRQIADDGSPPKH